MSSSSSSVEIKKQQQSIFVRLVLGVYNSALFAVWTWIFYQAALLFLESYTANQRQIQLLIRRNLYLSPIETIEDLFAMVPFSAMFDKIGQTMKYAQFAAFIEIFFIVIGWVPSQVATALLQCAVRLIVIFGAMDTPFCARNNITGNAVVFAWSLSEIVRYSFYALNAFSPSGKSPYVVVWMRYTFFIFLYPTGLVCEMYLLASTLKGAIKTDMWSVSLPNEYNFVFYWPMVLIALLMLFPPGFLQLYSHMFQQRRKVIGGVVASSKTNNEKSKIKKE